MNRKLKTHINTLNFRLVTQDDDEPRIIVKDGDWEVCSYNVSTIDHTDWNEGDPLDGWCVTSGQFETYRVVPAHTHKTLVRECHKVLASCN